MKHTQAVHKSVAILLSLSTLLFFTNSAPAQQSFSPATPLWNVSGSPDDGLRYGTIRAETGGDRIFGAGPRNRDAENGIPPLAPTAAAAIRALMHGASVDAVRSPIPGGSEPGTVLPEAAPAPPDTARTTRGHKIAAFVILGALSAATVALIVRAVNEDDPRLGVRTPTRVFP